MIEVLKNPLLKRFTALAGGSSAGQAIMFLTLPIATRLYTPEDFGVLASFSSLVLLFLPAACLRFDLAIPIARDDNEALGLVTLALLSATLFVAAYSAVLHITGELWGQNIQEVIQNHLWLVGLALWAGSLFSIAQYWAIRMRRFKDLAISHAVRGLAGAATQIGLGSLGVSSFGLLLGQSIYLGLGAFTLLYGVLIVKFRSIRHLTRSDLGATLRKNWKFPIFSTPEALLNSASAQLPMLLIVSLMGIEAGGVLYLAQRLTSIPVGLVSGNLARVYVGEAPQRDREKRLFGFTIKLLVLLFLSALPFAIVIFLFAESLATLLFGPEWISAALYLSWLTPAALLQFSVVPVATVLHIRSKQFVALFLQGSGFLLQVGSILICHDLGSIDPVLGFSIGSAFHYGIYFIVVVLAARDRIGENTTAVK